MRLEKRKIKRNGSTRVLLDVTNTGKRAGSEVVQMYIRDLFSSVTRPIKELKGFQKVFLKAGETKTVAIDITPEALAFFDVKMKYIVEPGDFEIMVGNSSRDEDLQKMILRVRSDCCNDFGLLELCVAYLSGVQPSNNKLKICEAIHDQKPKSLGQRKNWLQF